MSSNRLRTSLGHGVAGGGMVASVPEPASVIPRRTRRTVPPPLAFPLDKRPWRSEKVFVLAAARLSWRSVTLVRERWLSWFKAAGSLSGARDRRYPVRTFESCPLRFLIEFGRCPGAISALFIFPPVDAMVFVPAGEILMQLFSAACGLRCSQGAGGVTKSSSCNSSGDVPISPFSVARTDFCLFVVRRSSTLGGMPNNRATS